MLSINASLMADREFVQSSAAGAVPAGQLRRGFLYYIERGRAHPYQPFLHYNSWYDISWAHLKFRDEECLAVVEKIWKGTDGEARSCFGLFRLG